MNYTATYSLTHSARRRVLAAAAAVLALGPLHSSVAWSQSAAYPAKAITFIVPIAAVSATDQLAGAVGQ